MSTEDLYVANNKIYLKLSNGKTRNIGDIAITKNGKTIISKELEREKHVMRVNDSVGFCYEMLKLFKGTDELWIRLDGKDIYYITICKAREIGGFLHFKTQGFERQLFVELNKMIKV